MVVPPKVFIIAEAGVNHNGDVNLAKELIRVAARAGADAVKFQTFKAENICTYQAPKATYQMETTGSETTQFDMLKGLELTNEEHKEIVAACRECGIEFMSTAFDKDSVDYLIDELGMKRIKVASGELTNLPLLEHFAKKNLPMIVSTGMSDLYEVKEAVETIAINHEGDRDKLAEYLTILHCTSSYPTLPEDVNLKAMITLAKEFTVPFGFSDHTQGILAVPMAVGMGATTVEKHFTLDRGMEGPDHRASLEPDELEELVRRVREVEAMLGDGVKKPTVDEKHVKEIARRSIVLIEEKSAGQPIHQSDIKILRPGTGIAPKFWRSVIGKKMNKNAAPGHVLSWDDIQ